MKMKGWVNLQYQILHKLFPSILLYQVWRLIVLDTFGMSIQFLSKLPYLDPLWTTEVNN